MTHASAGSNRPQLLARLAGIDRQRRQAALEAARRRYRGLSAIGKRRLLDELQELTGYHRKSLLRLLNRPEPMVAAEPGLIQSFSTGWAVAATAPSPAAP